MSAILPGPDWDAPATLEDHQKKFPLLDVGQGARCRPGVPCDPRCRERPFVHTITQTQKGDRNHVLLPVRTDLEGGRLHQDRRLRQDGRGGRPAGSIDLRPQGALARGGRGPQAQDRPQRGGPLHPRGHLLDPDQRRLRPGALRRADRPVRQAARRAQAEGEGGRRPGRLRPRRGRVRPRRFGGGAGRHGRAGRRESPGRRRRRPGAARALDLRAQGGRRLRRPRPDSRPHGRGRLRVRARGLRRHAQPENGGRRLPGPRAQVRRDEPQGHGAARCRQHRHLRPPGADQGAARAQAGQGHPGLRPRPEGPRGDPQADRRQRHQRLHPRRDAALPRLPRAQAEAPALLRPLRHGLAEPGARVRRSSPARSS